MDPNGRLPILVATPVTYNRIGHDKRELGFIAEDLYAIDPMLVNLDAEGRPDSIRFEALCAHLLMALKALHAANLDLAARIAALEAAVGGTRPS